MKFKPAIVRKNFEEWELEFMLKTLHESNRPMGNVASSELAAVLCGWLVGITAELEPVVHRSLEWLDRAIVEDEDCGMSRDHHRRTLHWAKALGLWMRDGVNDVEAWSKASQFSKLTMADVDAWPQSQIATLALDDYMALCFQAGAYDEAIQEFEKYHGGNPVTLKKALKPRQLAYALCLQRTRQQFDENELFEAGRKMLQANVEENWVGAGQYQKAATWLKIVYWHHDQSLSPVQTMLKAYDHMPNVATPPFLLS